MLKAYLKKIADATNRGDAREESYYPILKDLLDDYCGSIGKKNIHVTPQPKKTEAGNPDFRVWDGKQHITGYIEAKDPTVDNLERIEDTGQLKRYLHTFPNVILTNFLEFRLYRNGVRTDKVLVGRPYVVHKLKTTPPVERETEFLQLLEKFFSFSIPKVYDAKNLAIELAKRTRFLKDEVIAQELREEEKTGKGFIRGFYKAFKDYLISSLTEDEFSDLYAQTITYGLFAARTRSENGFNRKLAYDNIPQTIGILRDVFQFVSLGTLPQPMEWIIDDISEILSVTDVSKILHQFFHEGKGKDPIVHFYETFLSEYDPKTREMRGVYYTPEPVVSYTVRSLHSILKEKFKRPDGFADKTVTVLDPAAGTLTFLAETAKLAVDEFISKYGEGGKENFIKEHILKNFYAFELMMAPYAVGHLKMSFLLEELGYRLQKDDRVKLYLTNTLEMEELAFTDLPGMASLSEESHLAGEVKKEQPILVILGNPPYSGHSFNVSEKLMNIKEGDQYVSHYVLKNGQWVAMTKRADSNLRVKQKTWIGRLIEDYKICDNEPLGEKNPKWLQDDYVKFIRFAQWKIDQMGEGILGFITNHSYLDNPTFRGMRQSLMQSFDEIYILDLHGNSLKKEKSPDGSKDENVFDIQQGVAVALFIKRKGLKKKISHSEVWGIREVKYDWLNKHNIKITKWKTIKPKSVFYLFIPRDEGLLKAYERYPKITDVFPVNSVGIVTSRDNFVIDLDRNALKRRIMQFRDKKMPDEIIRQTYNLNDKSNWKLKDARETIIKDEDRERAMTKILYRPFDERWIFYHDAVIERSRKEVMQHMLKENLGLIFHKREELLIPYSHFLATDKIIEHGCLSSKTTCYLSPLYLYKKKDNPVKKSLTNIMMLFEPQAEYAVKKPNLSPAFIEKLTEEFRKGPAPEEIFYYIYAVLYSNIYRTKYAEFLKIDFPRVPFTKDYKLFKKMSDYGNTLVELHLLKSPELDSPISRFQGKGDNRVKKLKFDDKAGVLYINKEQYFEGISQDVWGHQIGGYHVCDKWLKDRKERILSLDEIQNYCRIVTAIQKTIETQKTIDEIYDDLEHEIISLQM
jgi:predicted helicase